MIVKFKNIDYGSWYELFENMYSDVFTLWDLKGFIAHFVQYQLKEKMWKNWNRFD